MSTTDIYVFLTPHLHPSEFLTYRMSLKLQFVAFFTKNNVLSNVIMPRKVCCLFCGNIINHSCFNAKKSSIIHTNHALSLFSLFKPLASYWQCWRCPEILIKNYKSLGQCCILSYIGSLTEFNLIRIFYIILVYYVALYVLGFLAYHSQPLYLQRLM